MYKNIYTQEQPDTNPFSWLLLTTWRTLGKHYSQFRIWSHISATYSCLLQLTSDNYKQRFINTNWEEGWKSEFTEWRIILERMLPIQTNVQSNSDNFWKRVLAWCPSPCCLHGGAEYANSPAYSLPGCEGMHRSLRPQTNLPSGWLKKHVHQLLSLPHLPSLQYSCGHVNSGSRDLSVCPLECYRPHSSCGSSGRGPPGAPNSVLGPEREESVMHTSLLSGGL